MIKLTAGQIAFLKKHKIAEKDLFDGGGRNKQEREAAMEAAGKRFYYGEPCRAQRHTLRAKAGHCIQCNPQLIAYALRFSEPARLYIAGSLRARCMKIGLGTDPDDRLKHLRSESYGGFDDWKILATTQVIEEAGRIENAVHRLLSDFSCEGSYVKAGVPQKACELFACNFATAAQALMEVLPANIGLQVRCSLEEATQYEWRRAA